MYNVVLFCFLLWVYALPDDFFCGVPHFYLQVEKKMTQYTTKGV